VYRCVLFRPTAVRSRAAQLAAAPPLAARLDLPRDLRRLGLAYFSEIENLNLLAVGSFLVQCGLPLTGSGAW
jgi:hypothetical protein